MKILNKAAAAVAVVIGGMAVIAGTKVLTGVSVPDYEYFDALVIYNVVMGVVSLFAGYLIWKNKDGALPLGMLITGLHILVLALLLTVFNDVISSHSISAMLIRSVVWIAIIFTVRLTESQKNNDEILI